MQKSEDRLITQLRAGSAQAFDAVYASYRAPIFSFLAQLCGQRQLAEDLFQNTWLKLARSAPGLRPDTDLKAWLFCVARNEYRSHRRWQRIDVRRLLAMKAGSNDASHAPDLDALSDLDRCLGRVSASERELLLLLGPGGFEQREAAAALGISHATLRKRLARARAHLARLVQELEP